VQTRGCPSLILAPSPFRAAVNIAGRSGMILAMHTRGAMPVVILVAAAACTRGGPPPAAPATSTPNPNPTAAPVSPDPRIGALFLGGADMHVCTGAVVHSSTGDLVLTAAHCLAEGIDADFVPAFGGDTGTAAAWRVSAVYLDPRWVATQDPLADYAFVRVDRDDSGSIEQQVGAALVLATMTPPGSAVTVTGYPLGVGGGPVACRATTVLADGGFPSLTCAGLVAGTSGSPWVAGSAVTGVTGGYDGGGCDADVSYSPPFDQATERLLERAQAGGPGDAAPATLLADC
jgi:Trypsin-like peptidase domain